jgi:hypothetical protein
MAPGFKFYHHWRYVLSQSWGEEGFLAHTPEILKGSPGISFLEA